MNPANPARSVLITGASIAGNACAWWLRRAGFEVTLLEKAPDFRGGGQNVDVRDAGRVVLRKMGLEAAALARNTGERGVRFVDASDRPIACFEAGEGDADGMTAELEILRGDLARLLHDAAAAPTRFGDSIAHIEQRPDHVDVRFASGAKARYDLVIVAEGVGSATRELVFPGENRPRWMGVTFAAFTIPKGRGDGEFARIHTMTKGRIAGTRPDPYGTTRAGLNLQGRRRGAGCRDSAAQKSLLRTLFAGGGWEVPRLLQGMEQAEDFYFDILRQVKMPRFASGRVVLTGDAAWCVTPIGGIGASLSIVGAYVLAGELSRQTDFEAAFAAYERVMRPFVAKGQSIPKILPRLISPRTRPGLAAFRAAVRLLGNKGTRRILAKFAPKRQKPPPHLPDYDFPAAAA